MPESPSQSNASAQSKFQARHWIAWLLLAAVPLATHSKDPASTEALEWAFLEAETALVQGESRSAASHYRAALREIYYLLGLVALAESDLESAQQHLSRARNVAAIDLGPARIALARVELRLGGSEQPLRELRLAAAEDRQNADAQQSFAEALWFLRRQDELVAQLDELRQLDSAAAALLSAKSDTAERQVALPLVGSLATEGPDVRFELKARLAASRERAERNLAFLQDQVETEPTAESRPFPKAQAFGKIDLVDWPPEQRIAAPRLDPAQLLRSTPAALQPVLEQIDEGRFDLAVGELRRHLEGDHARAARVLLGRVLLQRGELEAAEQELLRAVSVRPEPGSAHQLLVRIYWRRGQTEQATYHLRRAALLGELDRDLALVLADIELDAGRSARAERQLRSLDKRFGSVEAQLRLAELWRRDDQLKQALEVAERAVGEAPNSEQVLLAHARLALEIGVVGGAARSVEPLVRMRPEVAEYRYLLGRTWSLRGKMGEASEALLEAVKLDPDFIEAYLPLALALNHESRFAAAQGYFESYLKARPADLDALAGLAEAEQRLGQPEQAEQRASAVLAIAPEHPRAHWVIGMLHSSEGDFAAARQAFERAVAADPQLAKAHYQLSLACTRLGDRPCAQAHLELYQKALAGPEASYTQLERANGPTVMTRQEQPPEEPRP